MIRTAALLAIAIALAALLWFRPWSDALDKPLRVPPAVATAVRPADSPTPAKPPRRPSSRSLFVAANPLPASPPTPAAPAEREEPDLVLTGLALDGDRWAAIVFDKVANRALTLALGETHDGWRFASATRTTATFVKAARIWTTSIAPRP